MRKCDHDDTGVEADGNQRKNARHNNLRYERQNGAGQKFGKSHLVRKRDCKFTNEFEAEREISVPKMIGSVLRC